MVLYFCAVVNMTDRQTDGQDEENKCGEFI